MKKRTCRKKWVVCSVILTVLLSRAVSSDENDHSVNVEGSDIGYEGISGIIVDDTMTIIGRRFYEEFSLAWPDYQTGSGENFSIHEQPTARSGSRIWIEHDRVKLFEVFLSPVLANIHQTVRVAAQQVSEKFETLQVEKLLFRNPDLASDEI